MIYINRSSVSGLLLLLLCVSLSACCTAPESQPEEEKPVVWIPPAHEMEEIPLLTDPTVEIWRPGYWSPGEHGGFVWVPGRVIPRPSSTATWKPARWVRHSYGWTFEQGHWQ